LKRSINFDGFVKSPTSALRFISFSLRRTLSTSHDTKFARLEFGAFYFAIAILIFYEIVNFALLKKYRLIKLDHLNDFWHSFFEKRYSYFQNNVPNGIDRSQIFAFAGLHLLIGSKLTSLNCKNSG